MGSQTRTKLAVTMGPTVAVWITWLTLCFITTVSLVDAQDTFNEKPSDQRILKTPVENPELTYDPFTNETDSTFFNDSAIIDEFNKGYLHIMSARSSAIALASLSLKECKDEEKQCSQWAKDGYCYTNAGYMSVACKRSCDVCDLSVCADNHERCEEWAGKGECSKNKNYMRVACRKSCGVCGPSGEAPLRLTSENVGWEKHENTDCYQGNGGDPVPGKPDPYSSSLTLAECKEVCQEDSSCEGIIREASDGDSEGLCYLRHNIDQSKCLEDSIWELHTKDGTSVELEAPKQKSKWTKYDGVDCYEGRGGVAIQPDPYSKSMTLMQCQETCQLEEGCVAIIRKSSDQDAVGICYLRSDISIEKCARDPVWNLHQFLGGTTTPTTTEKPKSEWTEHEGKDCYKGAGGEALQPDPYGQSLSLEECRSACMGNSECVGIVRKTSDGGSSGICYLRKSIELARCDSGTEWMLHTNGRFEEDTTEEESKPCKDYNQYCPAWAKNGECSKSAYYMNVYCPKSCGVCTGGGDDNEIIPPIINNGKCKDTNNVCLQLAKAGHCYARPGQENKVSFMERNCRKSCGYCGAIPDHILDQQSCAQVTSIPRHVVQKYGIDSSWYGKFTQAYGLPVTASTKVDDRALMRFCYIVRWLYASHRSARRGAHSNFGRFIIIGKNQRTTEMPEYRNMDPYYDERARGFGGHVTSTSEENLLHFQKNKWRGMDMAAHEGAHNFHLTGLSKGNPGIFRAISNAFSAAMAAGKYYLGSYSMYARTDYREYFAEALDSYIGDTWASVPPHNQAELARYDNAVYQTLKQALPCNKVNSWIYVHNDIDQVISRTTRININYPSCKPEPAINIPKETDIKLKRSDGRSRYTANREKCVFPFSFNGRSYSSCTTASHSGNWYRSQWCATSTYRNGAWYDSKTPSHQNSWGYCYKNPAERAKGCSRTVSGKPCIFPFNYLGIAHNSCQGHGWCATSVDTSRNMVAWSRCDGSCYSREENETPTRGFRELSG